MDILMSACFVAVVSIGSIICLKMQFSACVEEIKELKREH